MGESKISQKKVKMSFLEEAEKNQFEVVDEYNEFLNRNKERKAERTMYFQKDQPFVMQEKIDRCDKAMIHINDILRPYWEQAAHKSTKSVIAEKMEQKLCHGLKKPTNVSTEPTIKLMLIIAWII